MSYLDVPRLHFAGTFIAKPSTVNNTASNFEPTVTNPFPSWNPNGNHFWQFLNCTVKSAVDDNGAVAGYSILNASVASTDEPAPVTRDMSRDKRKVLLAWLAAGAPG